MGAVLRVLAPALVAVGLLGPAALGALADPAARDRELHLEPGVPAAGRTLALGRLAVTFDGGTLYPLRNAEGELVGLFAAARGHYAYSSEEADDRALVGANLKRLSAKLAFDEGRVRDSFERVLLITTAPPFADLPWPAPDAVPSGPTSAYAKLAERASVGDRALDHRLAAVRLNGSGRYAFAVLAGGVEDVTYELDGLDRGEESLAVLARVLRQDRWVSRVFSRQSLREPIRPAFQLVDADVAARTADNRRGSIDSTLTFELGPLPLRAMRFALVNSRDPRRARWDSKEQQLRVRRVLGADGVALAFSHRGNELLVDLGAPEPAGSRLMLRFETEGDVFTDIGGGTHDNYFALCGVPWYPQPLARGASLFTFRVGLRVAKPWVPVAPGTTLRSVEDETGTTLTTESTVPVRELALFAGTYRVRTVAAGPLTVRAYAYALARDDELQAVVDQAALIASLYTTHFGPPPLGELNVIELPSFGEAGQSPPGITLVTSLTFRPRDAKLEQTGPLYTDAPDVVKSGPTPKRGLHVLAHELGHQWFGHRAIPAGERDAWIAESIAEYAGGLAVGTLAAEAKRGSALMLDFEQFRADWASYESWCRTVAPISSQARIAGELAPSYRGCLLYDRGPLVLHMLRGITGPEAFLDALHRLVARAPGPVTTADVARAFSAATGRDLAWFFDEWIDRPGTPHLVVTRRVESTADGAFVLAGELEQPAAEFKRLEVPLEATLDDGRVQRILVPMTEPKTSFRVTLAAHPRAVEVAAHELLAVVK